MDISVAGASSTCFLQATPLSLRRVIPSQSLKRPAQRISTHPFRRAGPHACISAAADAATAGAAQASPIAVPPAPHVVTVDLGPGRSLTLETGRVARQAGGAVIVRRGDTVVLCTACGAASAEAGVDFLPLRVDYAEKFSAAGKTPGSYIKREGRPSEHEILTARIIDRPLRPMFEDGYYNETQVVANVMSYDEMHAGDVLAVVGCAAALHISEIPLVKAVAGVRVARIGDEFVVEPNTAEMDVSKTIIVVAGTRDAVLMVEGACDFLTEDEVLEAVELAQAAIAKICDGMDELRALAGKEKRAFEKMTVPDGLFEKFEELTGGGKLDEAIYGVMDKLERQDSMAALRDTVYAAVGMSAEEKASDPRAAAIEKTVLSKSYTKFVSARIRSYVFDHNRRADSRNTTTVRPITIDQSYLPCTHGSSLFTRGETQTLAVATLGGQNMAQRSESLRGEHASRFYLHYSFPPSCVNELGRIGAPGRREIGHGKLAERALAAVLPPRDVFPYVVRLESNITESCGSSSMATVCGGCLALMDAGVPISEPVAGIAMGLLLDRESDRFAVLTDILGLEDALGDMDFKIAGTAAAVTALQMDIKVEGITIDIMRKALKQAKDARLHILGEMAKAQSLSNVKLPSSLPRVRTMQVPVKRIGDVIGPGGKNIKALIERCGGEGKMSINIDDSGIVSFTSSDDEMITTAIDIVRSMTVTVELGTRLDGTVSKILPFGAYVAVDGGGKEGFLHISDLEKKRTSNVEDVIKVGDRIRCKVIEVGRNGQIKLSRKACLDDVIPSKGSEQPKGGASPIVSATKAA